MTGLNSGGRWKRSNIYMELLGFKHRQLRCLGDTNKGTIYEAKLVGNSPEICRGLDSHGFADLEASVLHHTALTAVYDIDDKRAFRMGTPKEVWSTLTRCWEIAPSSERIVQDISKFKFVLQKIINANGCVVRDEALRSGARYLRLDENGECKHRPSRKQRKGTLVAPITHPDALEALLSLLVGAQAIV